MKQPPLAIIVFGCAVSPLNEPTPALQRRLQRAVQEWRRQTYAHIIVSGGAVGGRACEAEVMQTWLRERGVPEQNILREEQAKNTFENSLYSVALAQQCGAKRIILVTERYHMPRCLMLFKRALLRAGLKDMRLERSSAPDNLKGAARFGFWLREQMACLRDILRRVPRPLRAA